MRLYSKKQRVNATIIKIGWIACCTVCILDFVVSTLLGWSLPGYDPIRQTISALGRSGQATAPYVAIWGVVFSILFLLFARAWFVFFENKNKLVYWSTALLLVYGIGEGLGSGLIHFDVVNGHPTFSGHLHQIFSSIADIGLFSLPFLVMRLFPKNQHPGLHWISITVILLGLAFNLVFLWGKHMDIDSGPFAWFGLWQRLFLVDYYLYLMILAKHIRRLYKENGLKI